MPPNLPAGAREHAQQTLTDTLSAARRERMVPRSDTPRNLVRSEEIAVTMATPDAPSARSSAKPAARFVFTSPRRLRLDLIGASALVVAVAGLGATVVLVRTLPAEPNATAVASAVPVRDQWYLERPALQTAGRAALPASAVKDRWYLDPVSASIAHVGGAPVRDQWYLEQAPPRDQPSPSTPGRDRWYLDSDAAPAAPPLPRPQDIVRDRWYSE